MESIESEIRRRETMFLSHGGRPTKGNGRKRKGVDEYASENRIDFTSRSIIRDGQLVRILVCRFCCQSIGARSDRIKEHLASKRHQKLKLEAFREAAEAGRDLSQEYSDDSVTGLLPEPPITMLKFPGKALAHFLEGGEGGRHQSRELTPEGEEDMKHVISHPPPLKERLMNLGSTHPPLLGMHSVIPPNVLGLGRPILGPQGNGNSSNSSSGNGSGVLGGNPNFSGGPISSGNSIASSPPPRPSSQTPIQLKENSSPQQLLCVRWGNFDSNIISMFSKLKSQESFVDVTLWCEGRTVKCHKIILSACSTYFETLLTETPNSHPIIFLKDMKFWEIQALVEFMYKGEVSIHQEKLQCLLRAAESLQIKGLGSPSNERNGFGCGNGNNTSNNGPSEDNNNSSNPANGGDGSDENTLDNNSSNASQIHQQQHGTPSQQLRQSQQPSHRSLFNSPTSNSTGNSLLKNSQFINNSMGIDLSNHGKPTPNHTSLLNNLSLASSPPGLLHQHYIIPAKRRKRETPRKIGAVPTIIRQPTIIPTLLPQIPLQYSNLPLQQQQQQSEEDAASNDSMDEDETNNLLEIKSEHQQPDVQNEDSIDAECQDNFAENSFNETEASGIQSNDEESEQEHEEGDGESGYNNDEDMEDNGDGGGDTGGPADGDDGNPLDLGTTGTVNSLAGFNNDQRERERSRKGNPIKKVHLGNNNNNYNDEESTPSLIQTSTD